MKVEHGLGSVSWNQIDDPGVSLYPQIEGSLSTRAPMDTLNFRPGRLRPTIRKFTAFLFGDFNDHSA